MGEKELLIIVSTLFSGVVGLVVYLWKQKDKQYEKFSEKLDAILDGINNTTKELEGLKKDNEMVLKENEHLRRKEEEIRDDVSNLKLHVGVLLEFKKNTENKLNL